MVCDHEWEHLNILERLTGADAWCVKCQRWKREDGIPVHVLFSDNAELQEQLERERQCQHEWQKSGIRWQWRGVQARCVKCTKPKFFGPEPIIVVFGDGSVHLG